MKIQSIFHNIAASFCLSLFFVANVFAAPIVNVDQVLFVPNTEIEGMSNFAFGFSAARKSDGTILIGGVNDDLPAVLRWTPGSGALISTMPIAENTERGFANHTALLSDGTVRFFGHSTGGPQGTSRASYWNEAGELTVLIPDGAALITVGLGMSSNGVYAAGPNGSQETVYNLETGNRFELFDTGSDTAGLVNNQGVAAGTGIWKSDNYGVKLHGSLKGEFDVNGAYSGITDRYILGNYFSVDPNTLETTSHAALWDLETLEMLADFGANTTTQIGSLAEDDGVAFLSVMNSITGDSSMWGWSIEDGLFQLEIPELSGYSFASFPFFLDKGSLEIFGFGTRLSDGVNGFFYLHANAQSVAAPEPGTWLLLAVAMFSAVYSRRFNPKFSKVV